MSSLDPLAHNTSRRTFARLLGAGTALGAFAPSLFSAACRSGDTGARASTAGAAASPPDPASSVLLDSNENPYGPPPAALAAIAAALPLAARYPDRVGDELVEALAARLRVPIEAIALGAGSSQILHAAANAFCGSEARAVAADPTFEALARYAEHRGAPVTRVPLTADYRHDLPAMAVAAGERGLVYVCNPNNPTASLTPTAELRGLLERVPSTVAVLVDEAYHEYADGEAGYESVVPWLERFPNLIVARTFSKVFGLAGLRCGYAVAAPARIAELRRQLPWDSLSLPALVGARAALADTDYVERARTLNRGIREATTKRLTALGARVVPSAANFLFADLGTDVAPVIEGLRGLGVRVGRRFAALPTHLRVTVGTDEEMHAFVAAFETVRSAALAA